MKLTVRLSTFLSLIFSLVFQHAFSQISIQSTKGYSVNVYVEPVELIVYGNDNKCTGGYNYDVKLDYIITFTGNNIPKSLSTLQGTINNGSASLFFQLPKKQETGNTKTNSHAWRSVSDCGTATVATLAFKSIDIAISGEGIDYQVVSFPVASVLPVKMVSFSAQEDHKKIKLNWQTATETNNDFFTVERSTNENDWTAIRKVKGAGNSTELRSYETYDESPANGTAYYRIKQTDLDGKATYSEIRTVRHTSTDKNLSLYPVPNTGNTIYINGITNYKNYDFTVLSASGNMVFATGLSKSSVELPALVKGVYFIRITEKLSGEATTLRYVKI